MVEINYERGESMNSKERIEASIAGEPVDRRAFTPVLGLYGARLTGCPAPLYYADPEKYALGQAAVRATVAPDVLCAPLAFAALGASFGGELIYPENDVPQIKRPAISEMNAWDNLKVPDVEANPKLSYFHEAIRRLAAAHGNEVPIVMVIPAPADFPELVIGFEAWIEAVLFQPRQAMRVIDEIIAPFYIKLVNSFFDDGASLVVMPCGMASPVVMVRSKVQDFTRPVLDKVLAKIEGPVILHNVGAPLVPNMDLLTNVPSVVGFIVDQLDSLAEARGIAGSGPVLVGGLDCGVLGNMTPDDIRIHCIGLLEDRKHDPKFVLGTSGPDVAWTTPIENLHAMRNTLSEQLS
jgi:uroporphyrinogen decarboxylase